jgi:preprotein translocase subunit Sec63
MCVCAYCVALPLQILGVARTADSKQIKKAYREQALIWHPDKWSNEEEKEKAETQVSVLPVILSFAVCACDKRL